MVSGGVQVCALSTLKLELSTSTRSSNSIPAALDEQCTRRALRASECLTGSYDTSVARAVAPWPGLVESQASGLRH